MTDLYIGMDGGGTRTTAVLVRSDGRILRRAEGRGMNWLNDGLEACTERFRDLIRQLLPGDPGVTVKVCAGCAALDGPAPDGILDAFRAVLPPGTRLMLTSDLSAALAGLTRGRPGLMAVCGTGSMVLIRNRKGDRPEMTARMTEMTTPVQAEAAPRRSRRAVIREMKAPDRGIPAELLRAAPREAQQAALQAVPRTQRTAMMTGRTRLRAVQMMIPRPKAIPG